MSTDRPLLEVENVGFSIRFRDCCENQLKSKL
jgi:hypothetical protein